MLFSEYISGCAESDELWNRPYAYSWIYALPDRGVPPTDSFSMYCMGGEL